MNRLLSVATAALLTANISGCAVPLVMGANIAAMTLGGKAMAERKAEICYQAEVEADKKKLGPAEKRRELAKKNCTIQ